MSWHQHCGKFNVCTACNRWNRIDWSICRNCGKRDTLRAPLASEISHYKQMLKETEVGWRK